MNEEVEVFVMSGSSAKDLGNIANNLRISVS